MQRAAGMRIPPHYWELLLKCAVISAFSCFPQTEKHVLPEDADFLGERQMRHCARKNTCCRIAKPHGGAETGNPPINRILTSLHRPDNTIKVQCVFAFKLRVRFAARSLEYAWYAFTRALRGRQRAWKAKISNRRVEEFSGFARRRDAEIPGVFQEGKPSNSPSAAHYTLIALSKIAKIYIPECKPLMIK